MFYALGIIAGDGLTPVRFDASAPASFTKRDAQDLMGQFIGNGSGWVLDNGAPRVALTDRPTGIIAFMVPERPVFKACVPNSPNAVKITNFFWLPNVPGEEMIISGYVL